MLTTGTLSANYGNTPDGKPYGIAFVTISAVFIPPLLTLWTISFRSIHRAQDPVRTAVSWIKVSFGLWIIFLLFTTIHAGFSLHQVLNNPRYFYQRINNKDPGKTILRMAPIPDWFGILANIILSITFIETGLGFLYCMGGKPHGKSAATRSGLRFIAWMWGVILFVMSLIWYAFGQLVLEKALEVIPGGSESGMVPGYVMDEAAGVREAREKWVRLEMILDILMLLFGLKGFVFALVVVNKTSELRLRNPAILFLVATILNSIRQTYAIIMHAVYVLPLENAPQVPSLVHPLVIAPLVDFVQMFAILVLLYLIVTRNSGGLWSRLYTTPEPDETRSPLVLPQMTPARTKEKSRHMIPVRYHDDGDTAARMADDMRRMSVSPMSIVSVYGREPNYRWERDGHDEHTALRMEGTPNIDGRYEMGVR